MSQLNLSARAYHRTRSVKLARMIADLAGCEETASVQLAEALHLRQDEVDVELALALSRLDPPYRNHHRSITMSRLENLHAHCSTISKKFRALKDLMPWQIRVAI